VFVGLHMTVFIHPLLDMKKCREGIF
jgi:hypothetical protein